MSQYDKLIRAGLLDPGDRRQAALEGLFALGAQIGRRGEARLSPTPPPMNLSGVMEGYRNSMQASLQRGALAKKLADDEGMRNIFAPKPVNEREALRVAAVVGNNANANFLDRTEWGEDEVYEGVSRDPRTSRPVNDLGQPISGIQALGHKAGLNANYAALPLARQQTTVPTALRGMPQNAQSLISQVAQYNPKAALTMAGSVLAAQNKYRKPEYHNVTVNGTPGRLTTKQLEVHRADGAKIEPFSPPTTSINMNAGKKADEGFVEWALTRSNALQENAQNASGTLASMNQLSSILDSGISTGFGTETITEIQRLGQRFGWTSEATNAAIASKEGFSSEVVKLILPAVKQLGVNPTDKDLDFIVQGNPSLGKTLAGNRFMIEILKVKAARDQKLGEFDRNFMTQNGNLLRTNPMEYRVRYMSAISELTRTDPLWTEAVKNLRTAAPVGTQLPTSLR
jgi:hypothetical protein